MKNKNIKISSNKGGVDIIVGIEEGKEGTMIEDIRISKSRRPNIMMKMRKICTTRISLL